MKRSLPSFLSCLNFLYDARRVANFQSFFFNSMLVPQSSSRMPPRSLLAISKCPDPMTCVDLHTWTSSNTNSELSSKPLCEQILPGFFLCFLKLRTWNTFVKFFPFWLFSLPRLFLILLKVLFLDAPNLPKVSQFICFRTLHIWKPQSLKVLYLCHQLYR